MRSLKIQFNFWWKSSFSSSSFVFVLVLYWWWQNERNCLSSIDSPIHFGQWIFESNFFLILSATAQKLLVFQRFQADRRISILEKYYGKFNTFGQFGSAFDLKKHTNNSVECFEEVICVRSLSLSLFISVFSVFLHRFSNKQLKMNWNQMFG